MSVNGIDSAAAVKDLTQTMLGGELKVMDQAMETAKVGMQMGLKAQEAAQTQEIIAQMTGVGGGLNVTV